MARKAKKDGLGDIKALLEFQESAGCLTCKFYDGFCERLGGFVKVGTKVGEFVQTSEGGGPRQITGTCAARRV